MAEKSTQEIIEEIGDLSDPANINPHSPDRRFTIFKRRQEFNRSMEVGSLEPPIIGTPENV